MLGGRRKAASVDNANKGSHALQDVHATFTFDGDQIVFPSHRLTWSPSYAIDSKEFSFIGMSSLIDQRNPPPTNRSPEDSVGIR